MRQTPPPDGIPQAMRVPSQGPGGGRGHEEGHRHACPRSGNRQGPGLRHGAGRHGFASPPPLADSAGRAAGGADLLRRRDGESLLPTASALAKAGRLRTPKPLANDGCSLPIRSIGRAWTPYGPADPADDPASGPHAPEEAGGQSRAKSRRSPDEPPEAHRKADNVTRSRPPDCQTAEIHDRIMRSCARTGGACRSFMNRCPALGRPGSAVRACRKRRKGHERPTVAWRIKAAAGGGKGKGPVPADRPPVIFLFRRLTPSARAPCRSRKLSGGPWSSGSP